MLDKKVCDVTRLKLFDEGSGGFTGYGSTFGNRDRAGEIVVRGSFSKSLEKFVSHGFIAVGHDWGALPVATVKSAVEDDYGLKIEAEFHSTPDAQTARKTVQERLERGKSVGLSIGYRVLEAEDTADGRLLKEIELHEVSLVTVPCNPLASVGAVKGMFADAVAEQDVYEAMWDLTSALCDVTRELLSGAQEGTITDAPAQLDTVLSEFTTAFRSAIRPTLESAGEGKARQAGLPFAAYAAKVLATVEASVHGVRDLRDRWKAITSIRVKEGRALSAARRDRIGKLRDLSTEVAGECQAMLDETEPAPKGATLDDLLWLEAQRALARLRGVAV